MPTRRRLVPLLAGLALAFPASALAQGAGDDEYRDPFGSGGERTTSTAPGSGNGSGGGSAQTPPDLSQEPPVALPSGAASGTETPRARAGAPRLPATGAEPALLALAGTGMLLAGVGLRLRVLPPLRER